VGSVGILSVQEARGTRRGVQFVDARPKNEFDAGHIPGALWIGWEEWCGPAPVSKDSILRQPGYWGVLQDKPSGWYEERLNSLRLSSHDPIVIYADGPRSRGREGRIAWMLLYLGAAAVLLLDGGWQAWLQMGGEVERAYAKLLRGRFSASFQKERRWTLAQITDQQGAGPHFVDTRSVEEFAGEVPACESFRGHIPGAVCFPFTTLFDANGKYTEQESFVRALRCALRQTDDIVAYCEVGVRASLFALLHEAYTGRLVSVFDGSAAEWALNSGLPLRTGTTS
jgi:thiosulfate/3-mercaptopyruvate sulfurtransferase